MELTELYTNAKAKMEKCMTSLERDFSAVRAGRANPAVLDKVMVDYYGVPTPVNQMAAISVPEDPALGRLHTQGDRKGHQHL